MNDEQFEQELQFLSTLASPPLIEQIRARDTAQRDALARVEAERDERLQWASQYAHQRDIAQAKLAAAVGLLKELRPTIPKDVLSLWCMDRDAFLARHAQAEQKESQYISIQEAWEAAGGNPGIKADREQLLFALKTLDQVCDEAQGAQAGEFWTWLDLAYRDGSKGEGRNFTKHNMEVAYRAGTETARAALATQLAAIKLPDRKMYNGLGSTAENLATAGWNQCLDAIEKLNAVRGAEHE